MCGARRRARRTRTRLLPRRIRRESRVAVPLRTAVLKEPRPAAERPGLREAAFAPEAESKRCDERSPPPLPARAQPPKIAAGIRFAVCGPLFPVGKIRHARRKVSRGVPMLSFRHIYLYYRNLSFRKEAHWTSRHVCDGNSTASRKSSAVRSVASRKKGARGFARHAALWWVPQPRGAINAARA